MLYIFIYLKGYRGHWQIRTAKSVIPKCHRHYGTLQYAKALQLQDRPHFQDHRNLYNPTSVKDNHKTCFMF